MFDIKMAGGDKLLEHFVLLTVLAKGDAIEYVVPTVSWSLHSSRILPPFLHNLVSPILKALVISKCDFPFLCVTWWG